MCVSLLERVKQGKSNIILILILSARSQDRDREWYVNNKWKEFQSTRSQDRDRCIYTSTFHIMLFQSTRSQDRDGKTTILMLHGGKFQSTRSQDRDFGYRIFCSRQRYFNPLGRKTETDIESGLAIGQYISIHSVARPRPPEECKQLVCEQFQSTRSQDRDSSSVSVISFKTISIHSVARPRPGTELFFYFFSNFNPLGRKTETGTCVSTLEVWRHFNPLGRKTET